jgi:hypothetical protein
MTALTRRRYPERINCWHVYHGDVCVGMIARRSGCPVDVDQWEWGCGFYPGTEPGQGQGGTAADFEACRAEFEAAWKRLLPTLTEASFQEWREAARLHGVEICHVGRRHEDADPIAQRPITMLLRSVNRYCQHSRARSLRP